jgi:hypothetical protein
MKVLDNGVVRDATEQEIAQQIADKDAALLNMPNDIRRQRDVFLAETDWTQVGDVPQAIKDKWATYRQALRDVPQQEGFPATVEWPTQPE